MTPVSGKLLAVVLSTVGLAVLASIARPDRLLTRRAVPGPEVTLSGRISPPPALVPDASPPVPRVGATPETPPALTVHTVELRRGDNLARALTREGVDRRVSNDIAAALVESGANLRKLHPRHTLAITWSLDGQPVAVRYEPSPWLGFAVVSTGGGWEVRRSETRPDVRVEALSGEVKRSLFEAVEDAGASPSLVLELVEIFSSDFDFTADTRSGDRFRLLVEKRYAGEQFVDFGRILVAQYVSDARLLTGVEFERRKGRPAYYDPDGRALKKSFLKSPLEFTRITSGFTYARPHPILGGTRPHLAIDYAAPVGTPVRAVAEGMVMRAGWNGGNGIQVHLRHRAGYETMYNHLSRLAAGVHAGARVGQRQVIGYVGSSGLSTGPHLDYRVSRHGMFVNPLGEKFIPGEPIPAAERAEFLQHARSLARRLEDAAPF
jgi:murein DD-endopeptidase MepM/ murein hydrolase activator NlpD